MATAEPWTPSRRMKAAATAERVRVERELSRLSAREEALAHELEQARRAQSTLQDELRVLPRLSHNLTEEDVASAPAGARRLRVVPDGPSVAEKERNIVLRGAPIRETAVRVLIAATESDQAVHYRTWYQLLCQEGFVPAWKGSARYISDADRALAGRSPQHGPRYVQRRSGCSNTDTRPAGATADGASGGRCVPAQGGSRDRAWSVRSVHLSRPRSRPYTEPWRRRSGR